MMRLHFTTGAEAIGVFAGLIVLGFIGSTVTPRGIPERPLIPIVATSPEKIIETARSGYQIDACVRDISSRTVLSGGATGIPELIVLEGAPVTECFPDLAMFAAQMREGKEGVLGEEDGVDGRAFGSDIRTSVNVLPPPSTSTPLSPPGVVTTTTVPSLGSTTGSIVIPTTSVPTPPSPIPTGGSSGGGAVGSPTQIPPAQVFDACRGEVFGDRIPDVPTEEETKLFEECLLR